MRQSALPGCNLGESPSPFISLAPNLLAEPIFLVLCVQGRQGLV